MWETARRLLAEIARPRMLLFYIFSCRVLKKCTQYVNESDIQTIIQLSDSEACGEMQWH